MRGRLRHRGKRRRRGEEGRKGKVRVDHELAERPPEASSRSRLGDWECDTVIGRSGGPCLVALVDRRSGYLRGGRAAARTKAAVADVEIAALSGVPALTVTPDRGTEFADWPRVKEATGAEFYFCAAHHPWEKGTVENTNGLLREYFPKGHRLLRRVGRRRREGVRCGQPQASQAPGLEDAVGGLPWRGVALALTIRGLPISRKRRGFVVARVCGGG